MKKMIIYMLIGSVVMALLITLTLYRIGRRVDELQHVVEQNVGKKYIINKDTVFITDYSILEQSYIDDKGKAYSFALIMKTRPLTK